MKSLSSLLALSIMLLVGLACSGNFNMGSTSSTNANNSNNSNNANGSKSESNSSAKREGVYVKEITLARDNGSGKPGDTVTEFKTSDNPIYAVVKLSEAKDGTKVKGEWIAVDAGGEKDSKFLEKDFTTSGKEDQVFMSARLPKDWPEGDYKINIYVNDKMDKSVEFKIK